MVLAIGCGQQAETRDETPARFAPDRAILVGDVVETYLENQASAGDDVDQIFSGKATLSTSSIDFGDVSLNQAESKRVILSNGGEGILSIDAISLVEQGGDGDRELRPSGATTLEYMTALTEGKIIYIAPGASIEIEVEWLPINTTADSGTLEISCDDPSDPNPSVALRTPTIAPSLSAEPRIVFPRVAADHTETKITYLQNSGLSPLQLKDIVLSPGSASDFSFTFPDPAHVDDTSRDALAWKQTLAPQESIPMRILFSPDSDGPANANIIVSSNDTDTERFVIALEGNVGAPCARLGGANPTFDTDSEATHRLEFGDVAAGRNVEKTINIINCSRTHDLNVTRIALENLSDDAYEIDEDSLPAELTTTGTLSIAPQRSHPVKVVFNAIEETVSKARVEIETNDDVNKLLSVDVLGRGQAFSCPTAIAEGAVIGSSGRTTAMIATLPLKTVQLDGSHSRSGNGGAITYQWALTSQPLDSNARLVQANTSSPKLFLDLAGDYEVELTVFDDLGRPGCERSYVHIKAIPDEDIHMQLVWDTPADPDQTDGTGTDLDLHYLHPLGRWDAAPYDIFWQNKTADWGIPAYAGDDPSLDIDDTNGAGPENINHDDPESGKTYAVGVYYYQDAGLGASYATLKIYIEGALKFEIRDKYMPQEDTFWDVAAIAWPSKQVFAKDRIYQGFPR